MRKCKIPSCSASAIVIDRRGAQEIWECDKGHQFTTPRPPPPTPIWKREWKQVQEYVHNLTPADRTLTLSQYAYHHRSGRTEVRILDPHGSLSIGAMFEEQEHEQKREWFYRVIARYKCQFIFPPWEKQLAFFRKMWGSHHTGNFGLPHARGE